MDFSYLASLATPGRESIEASDVLERVVELFAWDAAFFVFPRHVPSDITSRVLTTITLSSSKAP